MNISFGKAPTARPSIQKGQSIRQKVSFSAHRFDITTVPQDLQRVYHKLAREFGEEYALAFVFTVRTASELHRAWHMTLLTSKILQQIKEKFKMRMTWELGVFKLKFRVEDGGYELHRKVPYDYDSEFQDLYFKIAVALVEGRIDIHQALIFQSETKAGKNTAESGLFLRDFPGRLILYPLEAATCAIIFFRGDLYDGLVAAACGLSAGLLEYLMVTIGGESKILIDVLVGTITGIVGSLFYRFDGERACLPAIFLGTLYWFFYGTAFVIGILEIISGELETGVIRFMAVSVKTFVLTLGATFGMQMVLVDSTVIDAWSNEGNCGTIDLNTVPWRIPLYLLCSASALGQYRFPIVQYWRGLVVQLVGYEVQYQVSNALSISGTRLASASSNVIAAIASVVMATLMSDIVDTMSYYYNARILQRDFEEFSAFGEFMVKVSAWYIRVTNFFKVGRKTDLKFLDMQAKLLKESEELADPNHARKEIKLDREEERLLTQAIISAEDINIWSLLMPTVYQLVPGSLIAKLWFNSLFAVPLVPYEETVNGKEYNTLIPDKDKEAVYNDLMVTATTLALGLLLGVGVVSLFQYIFTCVMKIVCRDGDKWSTSLRSRKKDRKNLLSSIKADDPDSVSYTGKEYHSVSENGMVKRDNEETLSIIMEKGGDETAGEEKIDITAQNNDTVASHATITSSA